MNQSTAVASEPMAIQPAKMGGASGYIISCSNEMVQDGAENGHRVASSGKTLQFFVCFICCFTG